MMIEYISNSKWKGLELLITNLKYFFISLVWYSIPNDMPLGKYLNRFSQKSIG